jgi:NAD(P)-dependent dehydrogenase (short-subunit alcohol dehydrogenase family)
MQITILGVTRPIGAHAAKKALDHGHNVFVLVRRGVRSIPEFVQRHANAHRHLNVLEGDATNPENLREATEGSDAVLSFLGGRGNLKTTIASDSTRVQHLKKSLMQKLIAILPPTVKFILISNIGIGDSRQYQNCFLRHFLLDIVMGGIVKDKQSAEAALAESNIVKWTALRAGRLINRPENLENVRFVDVKQSRILSKVSREDIAALALKLVEDGYGDQYWGKALSLVSG